ncbi:hypothetical protein E5F05_11430 [Deinococcus metallilatus]|uniref:Lipoprotein n=1 Tax=Deinococcus metallilatus TaxID=1211322 RepID=A0AAJ5F5H7_9DEIO|nr:hypothetical protein [Deinococcus metallilatus]MBB5296470.1 hypothetical protein [Deinococcus metallilatus]QBY08496.1 hypothetical protein E5F05_11430 [Deinococcus metallilatus]RXJ11295.1 hypothetical protein ERJ73_10250 [Deinococcus metallilatus]TLK24786.1 hypothetical protein FCS05_14685 [Deinococcus metallilatus]GMA17387.1 hypothetical protein GCM10025871_37180 [Deinococcus metallilatus]
MKKMLLGAVGLSAVLASCGNVTPGGEAFLRTNPGPELRTNYIDKATGRYIACDVTDYGTSARLQNIAIVEFYAAGTAAVNIELAGQRTTDKAAFQIDKLRRSSDNDYIADLPLNTLAPASVNAQTVDVKPQYQYVAITGTKRGSFTATVSLQAASGTISATSNAVDVYTSCVYLGNTDSRD